MTMRKTKRDRLEKKGWKVGSADEFLDLSPEEIAYIDMQLESMPDIHDIDWRTLNWRQEVGPDTTGCVITQHLEAEADDV